jgi:hypothetical protein
MTVTDHYEGASCESRGYTELITQPRITNRITSPKSCSGTSAADNRWDSSRAAGNTPAKRPGSRYLGSARLACPGWRALRALSGNL